MAAKAKKQDALKPVYLITGSDGPKVEMAVRRLRDRVIADAGTDMNVDTFDAADHGAMEVIQAASTMPFGAGVRLVLVKNAGAWTKADKDALVTFLADPPPQTVVALTGGGIRKNEGLFKAVEAAGMVLSFEAPRAGNLPGWAQEQARQRRLKLAPDAAQRLVFLAGHDQRAIASELDKLGAYLGGGGVTVEDVDEVCWVSAEVRVWDLTDALGARDRTLVFRQLEALLADRTAPAAVFYQIARHLRMLASVVEAGDRGEDPGKAALALGLKPYPARKVAEQSRGFSAEGLRESIRLLSGLDADLKGRSDLRPDLALEIAVARILDAVA